MKLLRWFRNTLLIAALAALPGVSFAQIGISVTIAPPPLPVYDQPPCPEPNYIWTPGYWAWGSDGYYWVPGSWVEAPATGLLWTPGYWGWDNDRYLWHSGYWGPQVGFYGGVDYGYGYDGDGFYGGRWDGDSFAYNTAVVHVDRDRIRHTYEDRARMRYNQDRVSFNGGRGGIQARPSQEQVNAQHHRRFGPSTVQLRQASLARNYRQNYARVNHGAPAHAAMQRPARSVADFSRAAPARAAGRPNNARPAARPNNARPSPTRPAAPAPAPRTRPGTHPATRPTARPGANRNPTAPRPAARPENPTNARPAARGARTNARPAPNARRVPNTRPAPRSNARPAAHPASHPTARPAARPAPRPTPRSAARPAAQPHPSPRPAPHPAERPEARPVPHQARPRPHPQARPAARPQPHQQAHPAHPAKPEENPHEKKPQGA